MRARRVIRALGLILLGAVLASTAFSVAAKKKPGPAKRAPDPPVTVRATGVGLPRIVSTGSVGAAELVPAVRSYHDSGSYAEDQTVVAGQAESFLLKQAKAVRTKAKRKCKAKKPKKAKKCKQPKLALVLDIDETSLDNYQELNAANFTGITGALLLAITSADSPAIAPTLKLYRTARGIDVSVFFITGRPPELAGLSEQNLTAAGYTERAGMSYKPFEDALVPFKSGARQKIEQQGFRIIANVGDQESDLEGGFADRSFKMPNPYYFSP